MSVRGFISCYCTAPPNDRFAWYDFCMRNILSEKFLYGVAVLVAMVSILGSFGFIIAQTYVRWNLNKDFTFLGGFELEALTLSAFGLLGTLVFLARRRS